MKYPEFYIEQIDFDIDLILFDIDLLEFTMSPDVPTRRGPGPRKRWRRY